MPFTQYVGLPGVGSSVIATPREILAGNVQFAQFIPGTPVIGGASSRDPLNVNADGTTDYSTLRAGLLMGKISATGKYAPSVLGVTTLAYTSGGTTLTVSAATATEIVRRIGTSGTFKTIAPPTAAGTVATITTTFSAINTSTGAITVTSLGANCVTGALISPTDGSETILTLNAARHGTKVTDGNGNSVDVQADKLLLAGYVNSANIINWPADASLQTYVKNALKVNCAVSFNDAF